MTVMAGLAKSHLKTIPRHDPNREVDALETFGEQQIGGLSQYDTTRDALIGTGSQQDRVENADRAREQSGAAMSNLEGQLERRQRGLGLNLTDRQRASQVRTLGLTRAITRASAVTGANRTSANLAGAANRAGTELGDNLLDLSQHGLTQLANAEGQRNQRIAREKAEKKAQRNALIGQVIGIGMGFM